MGIFSTTHKDSQDLIRHGQLPMLDKLGKNLVMEELVNVVQKRTSRRRQIVETSPFVSTNLIDKHFLQPMKLHTMIQAYMKKLEMDMSTLDDSISMIETIMEKLSYRRIKSLYNQLEVWTAYLQRKRS